MIFTPITINNESEDFEERLDLKSKDIIKIVEYRLLGNIWEKCDKEF